MKQFETKERELGGYMFYVRPLPAFTAAGISGEIFGIIVPALGSIAPLLGAKGDVASLFDIDTEIVAKALATGASGLSFEKLEYLLRKLLVQYHNISFESIDKKGKPQVLTEELANDVFCGDVHHLYILAIDVIKSNYSGFFEKLGSLFGGHAGALEKLITKRAKPGLVNTVT